MISSEPHMGTSLTRDCVDNTRLYNTYSKVELYSGFIRVLRLVAGLILGFRSRTGMYLQVR